MSIIIIIIISIIIIKDLTVEKNELEKKYRLLVSEVDSLKKEINEQSNIPQKNNNNDDVINIF